MSAPELNLVIGALTRAMKPKGGHGRDALAKRWRAAERSEPGIAPAEVTPLLHGWIRRLEREAGPETIDPLR